MTGWGLSLQENLLLKIPATGKIFAQSSRVWDGVGEVGGREDPGRLDRDLAVPALGYAATPVGGGHLPGNTSQ